jgi:protein SCO1/2
MAIGFLFIPISGIPQDPADHLRHTVLDTTGSTHKDSLYQLEKPWRQASGKAFTLSDLKGVPAVLLMFYTSCEYVCPLLVADLKEVESRLPKKILKTIKFVLFSFDPKRDTPETLTAYARKMKLDPSRWILNTAPEPTVREMSLVLGVKYKPESTGNFSHSYMMTLIDKNGVIQHQQIGKKQSQQDFVTHVLNQFNPER